MLHQSSEGYLVYCSGCGGFQLNFGTFFINQSLEELRCFAHLIHRHHHRHAGRGQRDRRDVYLETPYPGFGLLFSPRELERLNTILQTGLLILQAGDPIHQQ